MEELGASVHPDGEDHHCHDHAHFTPACETCQRARAAFLPYRNVDQHPPGAPRSFGINDDLSSAAIASLTHTGVREAIAYGAAEGVAHALVEAILDTD